MPDAQTIAAVLDDYIVANAVQEPEIQKRMRQDSEICSQSNMRISPGQVQLLELLTRALRFQRAINVGPDTGYSSLCIALAMPPEGRLVAGNMSKELMAAAQRYWREAGIAHKIDLRPATALETFDGLIHKGECGRFDLVCFDADKVLYSDYYERAIALLRPGGLIAISNSLRHGKVTEPSVEDDETCAVRNMNRQVFGDARVRLSLLAVAGGLALVLKK